MKYENFDMEEEKLSFFRRCMNTRTKKTVAFFSISMFVFAITVICAFSLQNPSNSKKNESCATRPCENSGRCRTFTYPNTRNLKPTDWTECSCAPGFSGKFCEITPCSENPCQNGGSCAVGYTTHQWSETLFAVSFCTCTPKFYGPHCKFSVAGLNVTEWNKRINRKKCIKHWKGWLSAIVYCWFYESPLSFLKWSWKEQKATAGLVCSDNERWEFIPMVILKSCFGLDALTKLETASRWNEVTTRPERLELEPQKGWVT